MATKYCHSNLMGEATAPQTSADHNPLIEDDHFAFTRIGMVTSNPSPETTGVFLTRGLVTSGFLSAITPEDLKTLLYLLTYVEKDGRCQPIIEQLARDMAVSAAKVKSRLARLSQVRWNGRPVVVQTRRMGTEAYQLASSFLGVGEISTTDQTATMAPGQRSHTPLTPAQPSSVESTHPDGTSEPPGLVSTRQIIEASRRSYGEPREAVERNIAKQMGWQYPFQSPNEKRRETEESPNVQERASSDRQASLHDRLIAKGITSDQAQFLTENYPINRIERQLDWLPYRNAKNPASFLVAAIREDYEAPSFAGKRKSQRDHLDRSAVPPRPIGG